MGLSFVWALIAFFALFSLPSGSGAEVVIYQWVTSGDFQAAMGFLLDPLSAVMILVVTGVGLLIHIYSIGYMHGDEGFQRYFAYLNLFIFHAPPGHGEQFLVDVPGMGRGGAVLVPLDRLLVHRQAAADAGRRPSSSIG